MRESSRKLIFKQSTVCAAYGNKIKKIKKITEAQYVEPKQEEYMDNLGTMAYTVF